MSLETRCPLTDSATPEAVQRGCQVRSVAAAAVGPAAHSCCVACAAVHLSVYLPLPAAEVKELEEKGELEDGDPLNGFFKKIFAQVGSGVVEGGRWGGEAV